jgi:hypothetical protein
MGALLLSYLSAETLSWVGFIVLIAAMLGEVAVWLIPDSTEWHKQAAFVFAALAVAGYAVERVGDDAIIRALDSRATSAEAGLKTISTARTIKPDQHAKLASCLKDGPKGPVSLRPGFMDEDAEPLGDEIGKIFEEVGGFPQTATKEQTVMSWRTPGIFLIVKDLHNAPAQATTIQRCFFAAGIEIYGYADPSYAPDAVTIGIGPRT